MENKSNSIKDVINKFQTPEEIVGAFEILAARARAIGAPICYGADYFPNDLVLYWNNEYGKIFVDKYFILADPRLKN